MADRKISDLTALTTPATGDLIPIVDISEAAAADKNKSITVGELLRGAPDGTAAAPGIAFESDGGNGMFLGGTDILAFSTGGSQAVTIDASQRVGIGTTSVQAKTHIVDSAVAGTSYNTDDKLVVEHNGTCNINLISNTTGANFLIFSDTTRARGSIGYDHTSDYMRFSTGGTERARIDSSGRLLVGTSTSRSFNTHSGAIQVDGDNYSESTLSIVSNSNGAEGAYLFFVKQRSGSAGGNTVVQNGDIIGEIRFNSGDGTDCESLSGQIQCVVDGTPGSNDTPGRLVFSVTSSGSSSPTERMRINNVGNIGIYSDDGILYPSTSLGSSTTNYYMYCRHSATGVFSGTMTMNFRTNGGIANYQSNDVNLCDEREKKNIEALDSTWSCLKHWDLKKFHYNEDDDNDDKRYGVIAQQVAPHCPEVITDWVKQEAAEAVLDEDGNVVTPAQEEIVRMGVKEQQMMWMAIKALQEAQTRIETLEAEVAALKGA